jgi:hypothetical protein
MRNSRCSIEHSTLSITVDVFINHACYIHFCRLKNPSMAIAIATITPSTSG